ncbi:MAG: CoA pyrophosphatase [Acidimicrobiia bacterium]|nr:CoA pyrophosphatase [Acidimicrobiia bacterium]
MSERGGPQFIPRPEQWRMGGAPPWAQLPVGRLSTDVVANRVAGYTPSEIVRGPAVKRPTAQGRQSAVLVALYDGVDGANTILTRRPQHMRKHAGEISFPGGAHDDTDESLWHTATREAHEEVSLDPRLPRQVGELDRFVTGASFSLVQPIVARLDEPPTLVASPDEVDVILHVPLLELLSPDVYRQEEWFWDGHWRKMHYFDLVGDTVWGATALMLYNLLEVSVADV